MHCIPVAIKQRMLISVRAHENVQMDRISLLCVYFVCSVQKKLKWNFLHSCFCMVVTFFLNVM